MTSFTDGSKTDFPRKLGRRTAHRFNFSDQHVLPQTLGIPSVSSRLCFDSGWMTGAVAVLQRTGIVRLFRRPWRRTKVVDLLEKSNWGSEIYAAKVEAIGILDGRPVRYHGSVSGEKEFYATGRVAAYVAKQLYSGQFPRGVFHIEELFQPADLFANIKEFAVFEE